MITRFNILYRITIISALILVAPPAYSQRLEQATRESDRFGAEREKEAERQLERAPKKQPPPTIEKEAPVEGETKFPIKKIVLDGCESFPPEDFSPITQKYENREVTMTELNNLIGEIESDYMRRGIIAVAFLPPQETAEGIVKIQVVEARMGELEVKKPPFFSKKKLASYWTIAKGEILKYYKIAKNAQAMNKNPDREVKVVLRAGKKQRETDVVLTAKTRFPIHSAFSFDREGMVATGRERITFGLRDNNAIGLDDMAMGGYMFGKDFSGIYGYHNIPINAYGTSLLYGYSYSKSTPKKDYEIFGIKSYAESATVSIHQDIYEKDSYLGEVYLKFDTNDKTTHLTNYGVYGTLNRDRVRVLSAGGNFIVNKEGSVLYINPEFNQGLNIFGASKKNNPLSSRLGATPTFSNFSLDVRDRTSLPFNLQEVIRCRMQIPTEKLLPQYQFALGGIDTVRGYPPNAFLADSVILINAELQSPVFFIPESWRLPYANQPLRNQVTALAFFDNAYGRSRGESHINRLASVGTGVRLNLYDQVLLRFEWGFRIGNMSDKPTIEGGAAPGRFHIAVDFQDKFPEFAERIGKEMRDNRDKKLAIKLVDEELQRPGSPIAKRLATYLYAARTLDKEEKPEETKEAYAQALRITEALYKQAREYLKARDEQEDMLYDKVQEAGLYQRSGKLEEAKRLYQEIESEAAPKNLTFEEMLEGEEIKSEISDEAIEKIVPSHTINFKAITKEAEDNIERIDERLAKKKKDPAK